ncbi:Aminoglycoside phosphotransferase [Penicillium alfredii]|uniref:Aminoglycoside phosphotransferase n=1 Tax=Penicillium alfredii TaxID=1506179 RepID=A0A9W9FRC5_9EURO|nr:Aminoglycoside phosphotransferase [Penicillium alfredii]KAJ5104980.1 Aminoglycoside phosphotransferase [Penicillium alfredii]
MALLLFDGALGFVGLCLFVLPTLEEMALPRKEYRCFEATQNLKRDLSSFLDSASDRWVPPENWEVAKTENEAMFKGMLQAVLTNKHSR